MNINTSNMSDFSVKQTEFSAELENLPLNPILSTPTIKSRSMSNLAPEPENVVVCRARSEENLQDVETSRMISTEEFQKILNDLQVYR